MPNPFAAAALEGVTFCFAQVLGIGRVRNNIDQADQHIKTGEKTCETISFWQIHRFRQIFVRTNIDLADQILIREKNNLKKI